MLPSASTVIGFPRSGLETFFQFIEAYLLKQISIIQTVISCLEKILVKFFLFQVIFLFHHLFQDCPLKFISVYLNLIALLVFPYM